VSMLRAVARALGVTYEQLTGDLAGVTYSSIRAGMLEFRRWCEAWQYMVMVHQFCEPIWTPFVESLILSGYLGDGAAAEYKAKPENFEAKWDAPGWQWVDPEKEVNAAKTAIRAGLDSRDRLCAANGLSAAEIDREQEADNKRSDAAGLKYDSDGRHQDGGTAPQAGEPGNPDDTPPKVKPVEEAALVQ